MDAKRTQLYETHKAMGAKLVPFAGYDMPVWYSSVSDEHAAVREAAGLFDVSHMGVFEVSGEHSAEFLTLVVTNNVHKIRLGRSQYNFLLASDGRVIDDLIIYRTGQTTYMLVVNASNNDEDWAWLNGEALRIAKEQGAGDVVLRDLRDPASGVDQRLDIALQGPQSLSILTAMSHTADGATLASLKWGGVAQVDLAGFDVIVSRTGYTGERIAFELFVHPDYVIPFWNAVLATGEPFGLKPCGLASRDSTRTEAGLPLHGHELAGQFAVSPIEAGFGKFVKLKKPFFIGKEVMEAVAANQKRTVVRFRMDDKGVRRPELGDPIIDKRGRIVGHVTSCAIDATGYLLGLALVPLNMAEAGTGFLLYQTGGGIRPIKAASNFNLGKRLPIPNSATVLSRFPAR